MQQPFYSLRFPAASPPDPAVFAISRPVFYSPNAASFVFTRDLRHFKGSDASNIWDEEVGAGEIEFSDDEEEAEYRRKLKAECVSSTSSRSNSELSLMQRPQSPCTHSVRHSRPVSRSSRPRSRTFLRPPACAPP